ncbi:MAG: alpha/beta hydrolase [Zetaproteobacteria bacterium]|nr:alpha/beta hydrolase [Pseudobdellovibrionaceae bacterium]|tara:strand:+ start:555 stop:1451 length:897 start_codon:yes stop_codon:yes gene_type:complete
MVNNIQDLEEYPFQGKYFVLPRNDHYAQQNERKIHYIDEGSGETIVFVHGNPTWSFYFRNLCQALRSNYRVVALDHLGCGKSDKPTDYSYCLKNHINNFSEFMKSLNLNKKVNLFVHDWGGPIGLGWATQNKDKVKRIILSNTAAFTSKDIPKRIALLKTPFLGELCIRKFNLFSRFALYMASYKGLSKAAKKGLLAPYDSFENRIGVSRFVQDIPISKSHPSFETLKNIEKNLQNLNIPTLLLWGMKDFCFHSGFLKKWMKVYPHAKKVEFNKAGHYLLEDEFKNVYEELLGFVKNI